MKVGIDIDSTLNMLDHEWCAWIVNNLDPTFTLDKWTDWDLFKCTPAGEKVYDYLNIPGVFRNSGVRPDAQAALKVMADEGDELFVVSSCDPAASWSEKFDWVGEHFPFINKKNRIACSRKGLLKLDILIDDGPHNFKDFDGAACIFDQPWNRKFPAMRIAGWKQILEDIGLA